SMTNDWYDPKMASVVWLENDGKQNFKTWQIDSDPIHLVTVAAGDLDGDGRDDLVAGGLNLRKPFQRIGRITAWLNLQEDKP
ncbi:MAG TPA: VCBS repeat-containing protein, partial [Planctomycetaceae bacterium]|nr:VCBS repeat-containing protein [Planctomycetaceae bacterium]